ncbi:hypothetical protein BH23ACT2_BH23ACT2_24030 [soil metagenome]
MTTADHLSRRRVLGILSGAAVAGAGAAGTRRFLHQGGANAPATGPGSTSATRSTPSTTSAPSTTTAESSTTTTEAEPVVYEPEQVTPYATVAGEVEPEAKLTAARFAEVLTTYRSDEDPALAVRRALEVTASPLALGAAIARVGPLLRPDEASWGEVVYPQLGGLDPHDDPRRCSVMVVIDQHQAGGWGRRTVGRCLDLRLGRAADGAWRIEDIGDVSGDAVAEPPGPSDGMRAVLEHPAITMPDSVRWDIHEGLVDDRVLEELVLLADRAPIGVATCRRGHPEHVFGTNRVSAHMVGRAVDVWSVDGPLVQQREEGSAAYRLTRDIARSGRVSNLGSPWPFAHEAPGSFTDPVHQDHLHLGFR